MNWAAGGGASAGRHSAQSMACSAGTTSSPAGPGTQWLVPEAEHTGSQPATA